MRVKNFLVFDFGASNGRTVLAGFNGEKINLKVLHRFENNPVFASGILYWDILNLYSELKKGIQQAQTSCSNIASLGIDTWGIDFGFLDDNKKLIANPIHYRDPKRNLYGLELFNILSKEDLFLLTGGPIKSFSSALNLFYLKQTNSTEIKNANKFLMIPDIFNYFLTGEIVNEYTNVTTTCLFDQKNQKWQKKVLDNIGVSEDIFPTVLESGTVIADLENSVCKELEINKFPVVAIATHDTASAVSGIPILTDTFKSVFISSGTWCSMGTVTEKAVITEKVFKSGFFNEGLPGKLNMLVKDITGLWIIQRCREKWIKEKERSLSWDEIMLMASKSSSFYSIIDVDHPSFLKNGTDMTETIKDYCRKSKQNIPNSIGEIARCFYESLAMKFKHNLEILKNISGIKPEFLYLMGGGSRDELLCKMVANSTGLKLISCPAETATTGNLLFQLIALKEIDNLKEGKQILSNSFDLKYYEPENVSYWNAGYEKYLKILCD